jgi:hypothetical protein
LIQVRWRPLFHAPGRDEGPVPPSRRGSSPSCSVSYNWDEGPVPLSRPHPSPVPCNWDKGPVPLSHVPCPPVPVVPPSRLSRYAGGFFVKYFNIYNILLDDSRIMCYHLKMSLWGNVFFHFHGINVLNDIFREIIFQIVPNTNQKRGIVDEQQPCFFPCIEYEAIYLIKCRFYGSFVLIL